MRVVFFGTSSATPVQGRSQTCLYVEAGGLGHLVDCGDGASTKLLLDPAGDWSMLRALMVTHLHADHAVGMFTLLHQLHMQAQEHPEWAIRGREQFVLCLPGCEGSETLVSCLAAFHTPPGDLDFNLAIEYYRTHRPFSAGAVTVTPWPTTHCEEAHGFTIAAEGHRIVVSGDLGAPDELTQHARHADLVITECSHFHPKELVNALRGTNARHVIVTHLHERIAERLAEAEGFFAPLRKHGALTLAHDGLVVELPHCDTRWTKSATQAR